MPLPTITALPTAPSRSDSPATFNANADAFLGALSLFQSELNTYAAALPATISSTDFSGTSTTSLAIGTGSKTLTIQTGKNFSIGQSVRIANTATPANYMDGQVTAYNSGTGSMTVNVTATGGAGTLAAWTVSLAATAGSFLALSGGTLTGGLIGTTIATSGSISPGNVANLYLSGSATNATFNFDANDYLDFNRSTNSLTVAIGATVQMTLTSGLATFVGAIKLGAASGTAAGNLGYSGGLLTYGDGSSQLTLVSLTGTQTLTNKTLTAPVLTGAAVGADCAVNDTGTIAANSVGFRGLPASSNTTGTLALTDAGKQLIVSTGQTIPANASVAFPVGTAIVIVNNSASTITVAITSDTLRQAGTSNTGTRTIAAYGICSLVKVASTSWIASGNIS